MKIKSQFILLSSTVLLIPILFSIFILLHTYIHSPNRYLLSGTGKIESFERSFLPENQAEALEKSLKLLAKDIEAVAYLPSDRIIIYSSIPEIKSGSIISQSELWNFAEQNSDKYFFQFVRTASTDYKVLLLTRINRSLVSTEKKTQLYLKILLLIIILTFIALFIICFISRTVFKSLNKVEHKSVRLAEGKLDEKIIEDNYSKNSNEITMILKSLEKMRCDLLEVQNRKNRFIMGISHDLRTPVSVIKGYSEAIIDGVISDNEDIAESMRLIDSKANLLEDMIDSLLNFIKLNDTEIKQNLEYTSITELIKEFARYTEITGTIFKRKVITKINLPPKDISVPLNKQLVYRSLENLFNNAIRYTKDDGIIEIEAHTEYNKKLINDTSPHNIIVLRIKDNGSGINQQDLPNIFEMFYRGTNSRREEGMGIGLSVVKNIMDTHGWKISVESKKSIGSCFTIEIPFKS